MLLVDTSELYVDLAVDETDVVRLAVGQQVEFAFDALPDAENYRASPAWASRQPSSGSW
ncbi:MAG: hypothetical protein U0521_05250 [Anaerolineae bacterium]